MASPESADELPELETAALEELGADALSPLEPMPPVAAVAGTPDANPFGDLAAEPLQQVEAKEPAPPPQEPPPPVVEAAKPSPVSANPVSEKELTDDILGGVDFDVPAQSPQAAAAPPKPMPM